MWMMEKYSQKCAIKQTSTKERRVFLAFPRASLSPPPSLSLEEMVMGGKEEAKIMLVCEVSLHTCEWKQIVFGLTTVYIYSVDVHVSIFELSLFHKNTIKACIVWGEGDFKHRHGVYVNWNIFPLMMSWCQGKKAMNFFKNIFMSNHINLTLPSP